MTPQQEMTSTTPLTAPDAGMVWIPGGAFQMGSSDFYPDEAPVHHAAVDSFWMDAYAVTNERFARFVHETKYVTVAERPLNPGDYPGACPVD